jgi:predicted signal transduction protein with EAL and GGDEF domain
VPLIDDRLARARAWCAKVAWARCCCWASADPKGVNDTHGHLAGHRILAAVFARLEHVTRASDPLCRFGGDEFIHLSEGLTAPGGG